jgi:uncharacterized protein HemX
MDSSPPFEEREIKKDGSLGPLSATIVIVLILVVAGVYFLVQQERHARELKLQQQTQAV